MGTYHFTRRATYLASVMLVALVTLWLLSNLYLHTGYKYNPKTTQVNTDDTTVSNLGNTAFLADSARKKILNDASPIFGFFNDDSDSTDGLRSAWMSQYPDNTLLTHMNIPGAHDAATWNYSSATQDSLNRITDFAGLPTSHYPPDYYRCQNISFVAMLNAGIRAFDLRFAFDVTNSTLVFWHGPGLQSQTATVDDVMFGFYFWLERHPSEAIFLSFQREHLDDTPAQQLMLYNVFTSSAAQAYIDQSHGNLGTLGSVRGKIVLLKRFDLDLLPSSYQESLPGLLFSPSKWTVNGDNIELIYNATTAATAYIQDYYAPRTVEDSNADTNIATKFNATVAALERASSQDHPDSLFWCFASSTNIGQSIPKTPFGQALGNGTDTPEGGVNHRLVRWMNGKSKGQRLGLVMFDFFDQPNELLDVFLDIKAR